MFGWLARRRRLRDATYRFHNGRKWVRIDPVAVNLAYATHPEYNEEIHPKLADSGDPQALLLVLKATCDAFGVKPFDPKTEEGLTAEELIDLALDFAEWSAAKKNDGESLLTSANSMDAMLDDSNSKDQTPTLDSGSTPTVPDSGQPGDSTADPSGPDTESEESSRQSIFS